MSFNLYSKSSQTIKYSARDSHGLGYLYTKVCDTCITYRSYNSDNKDAQYEGTFLFSKFYPKLPSVEDIGCDFLCT